MATGAYCRVIPGTCTVTCDAAPTYGGDVWIPGVLAGHSYPLATLYQWFGYTSPPYGCQQQSPPPPYFPPAPPPPAPPPTPPSAAGPPVEIPPPPPPPSPYGPPVEIPPPVAPGYQPEPSPGLSAVRPISIAMPRPISEGEAPEYPSLAAGTRISVHPSLSGLIGAAGGDASSAYLGAAHPPQEEMPPAEPPAYWVPPAISHPPYAGVAAPAEDRTTVVPDVTFIDPISGKPRGAGQTASPEVPEPPVLPGEFMRPTYLGTVVAPLPGDLANKHIGETVVPESPFVSEDACKCGGFALLGPPQLYADQYKVDIDKLSDPKDISQIQSSQGIAVANINAKPGKDDRLRLFLWPDASNNTGTPAWRVGVRTKTKDGREVATEMLASSFNRQASKQASGQAKTKDDPDDVVLVGTVRCDGLVVVDIKPTMLDVTIAGKKQTQVYTGNCTVYGELKNPDGTWSRCGSQEITIAAADTCRCDAVDVEGVNQQGKAVVFDESAKKLTLPGGSNVRALMVCRSLGSQGPANWRIKVECLTAVGTPPVDFDNLSPERKAQEVKRKARQLWLERASQCGKDESVSIKFDSGLEWGRFRVRVALNNQFCAEYEIEYGDRGETFAPPPEELPDKLKDFIEQLVRPFSMEVVTGRPGVAKPKDCKKDCRMLNTRLVRANRLAWEQIARQFRDQVAKAYADGEIVRPVTNIYKTTFKKGEADISGLRGVEDVEVFVGVDVSEGASRDIVVNISSELECPKPCIVIAIAKDGRQITANKDAPPAAKGGTATATAPFTGVAIAIAGRGDSWWDLQVNNSQPTMSDEHELRRACIQISNTHKLRGPGDRQAQLKGRSQFIGGSGGDATATAGECFAIAGHGGNGTSGGSGGLAIANDASAPRCCEGAGQGLALGGCGGNGCNGNGGNGGDAVTSSAKAECPCHKKACGGHGGFGVNGSGGKGGDAIGIGISEGYGNDEKAPFPALVGGTGGMGSNRGGSGGDTKFVRAGGSRDQAGDDPAGSRTRSEPGNGGNASAKNKPKQADDGGAPGTRNPLPAKDYKAGDEAKKGNTTNDNDLESYSCV